MRIGFDKADFAALTDLWNRFYPKRYHIDPDLLKMNTVDCPNFDWGASCIDTYDGEVKGFVAVKRSSAYLYKGPDPDIAHLNAIAYSDSAIADDLFQFARDTLTDRGAYRLVFGKDSRHFYPGLPAECGVLGDFLMVQGFDSRGEQYDLERDLSTYEVPTGTLAALGSSLEVRPVVASDRDRLRAFLEREFPGRWTFDTFEKLSAEGTEPFVYGLFEGEEVLGFALTQDWGHRMPIGGAVWRQDLGEHWGALGPIGVSQHVRGRKLGDALLAAALLGLKGRGVHRTIIDWTTLLGYYGKHGFEVSRTYRELELTLSG